MAKKTRKSRRTKKNSAKLFFLFLIVLSAALFLISYKDKIEGTAWQNQSVQIDGNSSAEKDFNGDQPQSPAKQQLPQNNKQTENKIITESKNLELPVCGHKNGNKNSESHEIHEHHGYSLCYREEYEQAEWVAYCFTRDELVKNASRSNNFHADPSISTGSATPEDYTKSGYDRGHLAPAADLAWSEESMDDSFYMSNMSPQAPSFNRGIWKKLEEQTREWVEKFGTVYVVSGPVLEKTAEEYKAIGKNNVSVPEYYYKALLASTEDGNFSAIGFILPNTKYTESFYNFAVSIDEVEKRTNLDFFSALPDNIENNIESKIPLNDWK